MTLTALTEAVDRLELCDVDGCRNLTDRGTCSWCRIDTETVPPIPRRTTPNRTEDRHG
jgi:hypothetical protein